MARLGRSDLFQTQMNYKRHYKKAKIEYMPNGMVSVEVSQRDGFGKYGISINNGVLIVYRNEDLICMSTSFIVKGV